MLHDLLIFSPFMICLFWSILQGLLSYRTNIFPAYLVMTLTAMFFFMIDGYFSAIHGTPQIYIWFSLAYQLVAPALIPAVLFYVRRLMREQRYQRTQFLWVAIPAVMFAVSALLMSIIGTEEIVGMTSDMNAHGLPALAQYKGRLVYRYYVWSDIIMRVVLGLEMVYMLFYIIIFRWRRKYSLGNIYRFFFKGGSVDVLQVQLLALSGIALVYMFKVFFFKSYLDRNLWFTALLAVYVAVAVFSIGFFTLLSARQTITLKDVGNLMRFNYNRKSKQQTIESMFEHLIEDADTETQRRIKAKIGVTGELDAWERGESQGKPSISDAIFNVTSDSWGENSLMSRFQQLMKEEQLYLKPGLSLGDVAERLGSNKTYISKMVNNTYNMGFPELLNVLRVDYAQHYIVLHKDAKQDQIAEACGFFSASSFNNTFKRVTGMTPKMWEATR